MHNFYTTCKTRNRLASSGKDDPRCSVGNIRRVFIGQSEKEDSDKQVKAF